MKKIYLALGIAAVIITLLAKTAIIEAIGMFLIIGAIPGTHYTLSPGAMLIVFGVTIWFLFCHATAMRLIRRFVKQRQIRQRLLAHMPKRRYGQI
jgi:uncharacterized protein (DUF58 family)